MLSAVNLYKSTTHRGYERVNGFLYAASNTDLCYCLILLGGYIVLVTRSALKLKLSGVQKMGTIVFCVVQGTCLPHICNLHPLHQNHQHQPKVQVSRKRIVSERVYRKMINAIGGNSSTWK
jgi:hypothetical protein